MGDMMTDFKGFVEWWKETYNPDITEEDLVELAKHNLINETGKKYINMSESALNAVKDFEYMLSREEENKELLEKILAEDGKTIEDAKRERKELMEEAQELMSQYERLREKAFGKES
jgi:alkylhydroperoxidase/carboxymuconolactone decarboxylase family protein YurZ